MPGTAGNDSDTSVSQRHGNEQGQQQCLRVSFQAVRIKLDIKKDDGIDNI